MSKQLFVDPREMRAPGKIEFTDILENQYQKLPQRGSDPNLSGYVLYPGI